MYCAKSMTICRLVICLLFVTLLFGVIPVVATPQFQGSLSIAADTSSVAQGESFSVTVRMEENPGIASLLVNIDFDRTRLQIDRTAPFTRPTRDRALRGLTITAPTWADIDRGDIRPLWHGTSNNNVAGILFIVGFTALPNAPLGEAYVRLNVVDANRIVPDAMARVRFDGEVTTVSVTGNAGPVTNGDEGDTDEGTTPEPTPTPTPAPPTDGDNDDPEDDDGEDENGDTPGEDENDDDENGDDENGDGEDEEAEDEDEETEGDEDNGTRDEGSETGHTGTRDWANDTWAADGYVSVVPAPVDWQPTVPEAVDVSQLSAELQEIIGDSDVFTVDADTRERVLMSVPFTGQDGIIPEAFVPQLIGEGGPALVIPSLFDASASQMWLIGYTGELYMVRPNPVAFTDVSPDSWFYRAVTFVAARELFAGIGDGLYGPQTQMTRAMFLTVLSRLDDINPADYTASPFTDVNIGAWYGPAIAWANSAGIINTEMLSGSMFGPDSDITREEMAVIFANYLAIRNFPLVSLDVPEFDDLTEASPWARDAIQEMRQHAIISGVGGNLYNPQHFATRAEVAQIFTNLVRAIVGLS